MAARKHARRSKPPAAGSSASRKTAGGFYFEDPFGFVIDVIEKR